MNQPVINPNQLLCMIDILGFSDLIKTNKLNQVYDYYLSLLHGTRSASGFEGGNTIQIEIFSDTLLIWPSLIQQPNSQIQRS